MPGVRCLQRDRSAACWHVVRMRQRYEGDWQEGEPPHQHPTERRPLGQRWDTICVESLCKVIPPPATQQSPYTSLPPKRPQPHPGKGEREGRERAEPCCPWGAAERGRPQREQGRRERCPTRRGHPGAVPSLAQALPSPSTQFCIYNSCSQKALKTIYTSGSTKPGSALAFKLDASLLRN